VTIAYKSSVTGGSLSATSVQLAIPAGLTHGDVVIAGVGVGKSGDTTKPAVIGSGGMLNWNSLVSSYWLDGPPFYWNTLTNAGSFRVWHHVVDASDDALTYWTFTHPNAATYLTAFAIVYSDADPTVPASGLFSRIAATAGTSLVSPAITTTADNSMVLAIYAASSLATAPGGMTERIDVGYSTMFLSCHEVLQASAGSSGTKTATVASSAYEAVVGTIFLRPIPPFFKHSLLQAY
jgi:hypothetical protein